MTMSRLRRKAEPLIRRGMHLYWRFARPMTLGVRGAVFDGEGRVFLIKHSYVDGWHFPGGGVESGESLVSSLARELSEEGNLTLTSAPQLFGVYFNRAASRRDHVALYVVRDFRQDSAPQPNHEIVAHGFFPVDALPPDTTRGTRARLAEILGGQEPAAEW
ncbi:MAG: NUDIX domain-containing protein [Rhizobiales bacterium]|nr:NUDIX domain-containing protein [Hyphomicrobiales bacterium]OJY44794.1 MAG: NUDIX hydrolase [Rhizobiales bacterium 64-17]